VNQEFVRDQYSYFSRKASEYVRQLGFAGLALIWLFRIETDKQWHIPRELLAPGIWIVIALGLDLLHYTSGALLWGMFHRTQDKTGIPEDKKIVAPRWINWPGLLFFWGKIFVTCVAYGLIFQFLFSRVLLNDMVMPLK
jgi:hypothetical protein